VHLNESFKKITIKTMKTISSQRTILLATTGMIILLLAGNSCKKEMDETGNVTVFR
jgi:hypothetical protein